MAADSFPNMNTHNIVFAESTEWEEQWDRSSAVAGLHMVQVER